MPGLAQLHPSELRRSGHRDRRARRDPDLEDHPQRRGHAPYSLPPLRCAGAQPSRLGRVYQSARPQRTRLEGHHQGKSPGGHDRRLETDRSQGAFRPTQQHSAPASGEAYRLHRWVLANRPGRPDRRVVPPVTNQLTNFGHEYVWHCHILSHEENDMMRPVIFNTNAVSDILWRNTSTGAVAAWPMDGLLSSGLRDVGIAPLEWTIAGAGDFSGDGKPDILWRNTSSGEVGLWAMNGLTNIGFQPIGVASLEWIIAGVGDFNGDSKPDILWRNTSTGEIGLWNMNGLVNTGFETVGIVATSWQIAGVADFTGDGKPDILWRDTITGAVAIWQMNRITNIGYFDVGTRALNFTIAGVRDFNGDVYPDILWRDTATGAIDVWYLNGVTQSGSVNVGTAPTVWQISGMF